MRLRTPAELELRWWSERTPAIAAGLTDRIWNMLELLSYKVAPAPWVPPKRRGRLRKVVQVLITS